MKILVALGTRPEAIKLAPVIREIEKAEDMQSVVCSTGQHKELLEPFLDIFKIEPDYDFNIMEESQSLNTITTKILGQIEQILKKEKPELALVQGDTTTAFSAALASFYQQIKIGHVEAGLRSFDKYNPFPEEKNRELVDHLADLHFCPTEKNKQNLLREGIDKKNSFVTGNTVVNSLLWLKENKKLKGKEEILADLDINLRGDNFILVTIHRRESFGKPLKKLFRAIAKIAEKNKNTDIIFPVHLNPKVKKPAHNKLKDEEGVHLISPLGYIDCISLLSHSYFVITDSGGLIEEAPTFEKPVLIAREKTERQEAINTGWAKLVGTDTEKLINEADKLVSEDREYKKMSGGSNPFGNGEAAQEIIEIIKNE